MKYLRWLSAGFAALAACGYMQNAQALVIDLHFALQGERCNICSRGRFEAPALTSGGGSVEGVFNAAADTWESALNDNRHFRITVGWSNLGSGIVAEASFAGTDLFNEIVLSTRFRHFADPTPLQNEEFGLYTETAADFGGGLINSGRVFTTSLHLDIDLLTTALHEIGHVLGDPSDHGQN